MDKWQYFAPVCGWSTFADSSALSAAFWMYLPEADWHYINLVADSSVWESRKDSSMVRVHYMGENILELSVQYGIAYELVLPILLQFKLVPVAPAIELGV